MKLSTVYFQATYAAAVAFLATAQTQTPVMGSVPLEGQSFTITVVEAEGYVEVDPTSDSGFKGYVIDMIADVAAKAKFDYTLKLPSGAGSDCVPQLGNNDENATAYDPVYAAAYLCGQNDVLEPYSVLEEYQTDMYWSMYYVTNARQLAGKFSLPFKPPTRGLTMYGTATGINNFNDLIGQQQTGKIGPACVGGNTAYAEWLATAMPDLDTVDVLNTNDGFEEALEAGTCTVLINAEHAAAQFVKSHYDKGTCEINGEPVGIIGDGLEYGLTQMAVGFSEATPEETVRAISYWLNDLMTCAPNAPECGGSLYGSWVENFGSLEACGYVASPVNVYSASSVVGTIVGFAITAFAIVGLLA